MRRVAHYYEAHEAEYVKRLAAGQSAWDRGDYDQFFMRPFVERSIDRAGFRGRSGLRALELGCGTGALCCQLAQAGFDVVGIDISPTAIAMARDIAVRRNLAITYDVGDVCRRPMPADAFDLIVDGHLLHCIVFEHERRRLLEQVRRALRPAGEFWVETMLLEDLRAADPTWHLDAHGVLWARLRGEAAGQRFAEAVKRDGEWWLPQRLIARSRVALLAEFESAGLRVIECECYPPTAEMTPGGLRARCVRAGP